MNRFTKDQILEAYRKTGKSPELIKALEDSLPNEGTIAYGGASSTDPVMDELASKLPGQILPQAERGPFSSLPSAEATLSTPQTQVVPVKKLVTATKKSAPATAKKVVKATKKQEETKEEPVKAEAPPVEETASREPAVLNEEQPIKFEFPYSLTERMQDAQERQNDINFAANAGQALSQIVTGLSGAKYEANPLWDKIRAGSNQPVENVKALFKAEYDDPKSQASQGFKVFLKQLDPTLPDIQGDISATQLAEFYPTAFKRYTLGVQSKIQADRLKQQDRLTQERLALQRELGEARLDQDKQRLASEESRFVRGEEGRERRFQEGLEVRKKGQDLAETDRTIKRQTNLQDQYNKDKVVVDALKGLAAADAVEGLLNSNTPISDEAAKSQMARLSGEVGVLTDKDVERFGGSKAWKAQVQQSIERAKNGRLSAENKKYLYEAVRILRKVRQDSLAKRKAVIAKQGAKRLNIDVKEARDLIEPGGDDDLTDLGFEEEN